MPNDMSAEHGLMIVAAGTIIFFLGLAIAKFIIRCYYTMYEWYQGEGDPVPKILGLPLFAILFIFTMICQLIIGSLMVYGVYSIYKGLGRRR